MQTDPATYAIEGKAGAGRGTKQGGKKDAVGKLWKGVDPVAMAHLSILQPLHPLLRLVAAKE